MGALSVIVDGQIPRAVQKFRIGPSRQRVAVPIDHLQRTLTDFATVRWHVAHQHKPGLEHPKRRAQARQAAGEERDGAAQRREWSARRQLDDRGASALYVLHVVEITD